MTKLSDRLEALAEKANSTELMSLPERLHARVELVELLVQSIPTILQALKDKDL